MPEVDEAGPGPAGFGCDAPPTRARAGASAEGRGASDVVPTPLIFTRSSLEKAYLSKHNKSLNLMMKKSNVKEKDSDEVLASPYGLVECV